MATSSSWLTGGTWAAWNTTGVSALDMAFRKALVMSRLYTHSWGEPTVLNDLHTHIRQVMSQRKVIDLLNNQPKNEMKIDKITTERDAIIMDGRFQSPHAIEFPHHMPGPVQWAHWRAFLPRHNRKGLVIHLAGTGDHSYKRREMGFVRGLLRDTGTAGVLLQNPFYAQRRPQDQFRSSLRNVSDLFVMGAAIISECLYLLRWALNEGFWPLGLSGVSMGGHMASLAASNAIFPVSIVPCLSWTTASPVFTEGALSCAIPFGDVLGPQLDDSEYRRQLEAIPDCDWLERAAQRNTENKMGLARNLMWVLMHDFTCLENYPVPLDTTLAHSIIADLDAYVLRRGTPKLQDIWHDATVQHLPHVGHVEGYLLGHAHFRAAIAGRLKVQEAKYPTAPTIF